VSGLAGRRAADGCRAWPAGGPQTGAGLGRPAVAPDPHDPAATPHPSGPTPPLARPGLSVRACAQDTWPGGGPENQYDKVLLYIRIAPADRIKWNADRLEAIMTSRKAYAAVERETVR